MSLPSESSVSPKTAESESQSRSARDAATQYLKAVPWQLWAVIVIVLSGGAGFTATAMLLKLPKSPQCSRVFWPIASASRRIYCAQLSAEGRTVDGLLQAIKLVQVLPADHPLRREADRYIEEWAKDILDLAEDEFQTGNLEEAIAIAQKIPSHAAAHDLVAERIANWKEVWDRGQAIFADFEEQLREGNWNFAFREAIKLLNLDNRYWATQRYDESIQKIQLAQEESRKLDKTFATMRSGGVDNWIDAIREARQFPDTSYVYREAQKLIAEAKDKLLAHLAERVKQRNWQEVMDIGNRLPEGIDWGTRVDDWKTLAAAGVDADMGTVAGIQSAIATAQLIPSDREIYSEAQSLIGRWQLEIEDVKNLEKARELAQDGSTDNLNAAIAQADLVAPANPRYSEARQEIRQWTRQIQTQEDRPILDSARTLARGNANRDLQAAIAQASTIRSGRALYSEARSSIQQWQSEIERREDRPLLDRAAALANANDYPAAIATARKVARGRALYPEAQGQIQRWQQEIQAQRTFDEASQLASIQTPESLGSALRMLRQIPNSTSVAGQRDTALDRWSYQLLDLAQGRANLGSYADAIRWARLIPRDSLSYRSAQNLIDTWQAALNPDPIIPPPSEETSAPSPSLEPKTPVLTTTP